MNKRRLKNYRLSLAAGAGVIALLVAALLVEHGLLASRRDQVTQLSNQASQLGTKLAKLPAIEAEAARLDEASAHADTAGELAIGELLQRLGQDMIEAGAVDRQVQTGAVTQILQWRRLPVSVRFNADFFSVQDFLKRIEAYPIAMRADRISLTRGHDAGEDDKTPLQVQIDLTALTRADAEEVR